MIRIHLGHGFPLFKKFHQGRLLESSLVRNGGINSLMLPMDTRWKRLKVNSDRCHSQSVPKSSSPMRGRKIKTPSLKYFNSGPLKGSFKLRDEHKDYAGCIRIDGECVWKFDGIKAPAAGLDVAVDSPIAYDQMACTAVSFGSYYTTYNRGS